MRLKQQILLARLEQAYGLPLNATRAAQISRIQREINEQAAEDGPTANTLSSFHKKAA